MRHVLERLLRGRGEGKGAVSLEQKSWLGGWRGQHRWQRLKAQKSSSNKPRPGMGTHQNGRSLEKLPSARKGLVCELSSADFILAWPENSEEREVHMCSLGRWLAVAYEVVSQVPPGLYSTLHPESSFDCVNTSPLLSLHRTSFTDFQFFLG